MQPAAAVHELSVAMALVELASEAAMELNAKRVHAVHVAVGPLSGVVEEALAFSFEVAAAGTPIEGAALRIRSVPLVVFCAACGAEQRLTTPQFLKCPVCHAPAPDVRSGRELQLVALEIPDVTDCRGSSEHPEEE